MPWVQGAGFDVAEATLTDWAATGKALAGVDGVFHTAAAFDITQLSAAELCRINVGSTENVLRACAKYGVGRIVSTSRAAAVGTSGSHCEVRDESVWNAHTREPYAHLKVKAERRASELSGELGLSLVSVLPGTMLGPGFHRMTPTLEMVRGAIMNCCFILAIGPPATSRPAPDTPLEPRYQSRPPRRYYWSNDDSRKRPLFWLTISFAELLDWAGRRRTESLAGA